MTAHGITPLWNRKLTRVFLFNINQLITEKQSTGIANIVTQNRPMKLHRIKPPEQSKDRVEKDWAIKPSLNDLFTVKIFIESFLRLAPAVK
jgi:hypothetical protein